MPRLQTRGLLTPVRRVEPRPPPGTAEARYVRSYLWMRVGIGVLGIALPLVLVFVDKVAFHGNPFPRGSLSVYYYSGMRDQFVGILSATGIFLLTYKVAERNLDNTASLFAGACAVIIPLFPTGQPPYAHVPLTPLQKLIGESATTWVHFIASGGFLAALALVTFFFGVQEGTRARRPHTRSPAFWRWFHWTCTGVMVLAILWIVITLSVGWPPRSLLIGEWVAAWAFGASWLYKGAELDVLFAKPAR
ncbi:MAG TPA: hypothetical protein VFM96_07685 [Gaiellaceae bacterium]|nr:hypothetical protein [Gaiellaceae bacterium]